MCFAVRVWVLNWRCTLVWCVLLCFFVVGDTGDVSACHALLQCYARARPARVDDALQLWQRVSRGGVGGVTANEYTLCELLAVIAAGKPVRVDAAMAVWRSVADGDVVGVKADDVGVRAMLSVMR